MMPKAKWLASTTLSLTVVSGLYADAQATWTTIPGGLVQISAGSDGSVWGVNSGQAIWQWDAAGSKWNQIPGGLTQVSAGSASNIWGVTSGGQVFKYAGSANWTLVPALLTTISAAADGTVIGVNPNGQVFKWTGNGWAGMPGTLKSISAGSAQNIWGLDGSDQIYRWNGSAWERIGGLLRQIAASADGAVMGVNAGGEAYSWSGTQWERFSQPMKWISPASKTAAWGISSTAAVLRTSNIQTGVIPISNVNPIGPAPTAPLQPTILGTFEITVDGILPPPPTQQMFMSVNGVWPASAYWNYNKTPSPPGSLNCVNCAKTNADRVGDFKLSVSCPDPTAWYKTDWGGTCWKCPAEQAGVRPLLDNPFSWGLYGDVTKDAYCQHDLKTPRYTGSTMTRGGVNSGLMSWDCASGEFWQMYDKSGNWTWWGGACYSCPVGYEWTLGSPTSGTDCRQFRETAPVKFLSYNGCPTPDAKTMNLKDLRTPDKPFLDIGAGGCFACPAVDEQGNLLVTQRNATIIIGKPTGNGGCDVLLSYKPAKFPEPGLLGIDGVKALVYEKRYFQLPGMLTNLLHVLAENQGMAEDSQDARNFVKAKWEEIARNPAASHEFRNVIYAAIRDGSLSTKPSEAQKLAIASFQEYIRQRKMYLADVALNMYDTWKPVNDQLQAQRLNQASTPFYYGTVPYDFANVVHGALGLSAFGGAALFSGVASASLGSGIATLAEQATNTFFATGAGAPYGNYATLLAQASVRGGSSATMQAARQAGNVLLALDRTCSTATRPLRIVNIFKGGLAKNLMAFKFAAAVGPALILTAASIIADIAIDQFVEIVNARKNLLAAKTTAAGPVSLAAMVNDPYGDDAAFIYWQKAMEGPAYADAQLVQMAAGAMQLAATTGFAKGQ